MSNVPEFFQDLRAELQLFSSFSLPNSLQWVCSYLNCWLTFPIFSWYKFIIFDVHFSPQVSPQLIHRARLGRISSTIFTRVFPSISQLISSVFKFFCALDGRRWTRPVKHIFLSLNSRHVTMTLAPDVAGYFQVLRKDGTQFANFPMTKPSLTIGHSTSCDIRLQIPGIQAQHCTLREAHKQVINLFHIFTVYITFFFCSVFRGTFPFSFWKVYGPHFFLNLPDRWQNF